MKKFFTLLFGILAMASFVASPSARGSEVMVSAAASLANAFDEMRQVFEKLHPGVKINTNYAASNPLLRQIMEGAPVDVFASADQATMDKAAEAGVINPSTRRNFAVNELALIVPKGSAKPAKLEDLASFKHIALGNPDSVPAGRYAKQSLEKAGLWDKLASTFIQGANVRQALDYVARGEADAGFVYATDALQAKDMVDVAIFVEGHDPVSYPIAVALNGSNPDIGLEFLDFVISPDGQDILARYGFSKP